MMNLTRSHTLGTFYLIFAILAGLVGVGLSLVIRFDISSPGGLPSFLSPLWLPLVSSGHALMMIVFMMVPALFGGFTNWLIPMMIGADDMQFRRLNLLAFGLLPLGFFVLMGGVFLPVSSASRDFLFVCTLHMIALSFVLSAINFIATIFVARAPFMRLNMMPPFIWSVLVASFLMVATMPVMVAALTLKLGGLHGEADMTSLPVMMWFFAQPEFFILMLPALGIISQIIATFAEGRLVMEKGVNAAFVVMGMIGFLLWSQTILTGGDAAGDAEGIFQGYFRIFLPLIILPMAFIMASWLCTLWRSKRRWSLPMLWALGFISMLWVAALSAFSLAGSSSLKVGALIGHFHYILGLGGVFAIFAGWTFWFGKISHYQIRNLSGQLHFWTMFIAVHLTFLSQHFGAQGSAPDSWGFFIETTLGWQRLATLGACFSALSLLIFFYAMIEAFIRKRPASPNPWGTGAIGLEWQSAAPASSQGKKISDLVNVPS